MPERVAVVGGGAVGVTAVHDLATRGADATLYERGELAGGASGRAAGIVHDAFAEDRDAAVAARALERFRTLDAEGLISFTRCPYVWLAREGDDSTAAALREQVPRMQAHGRDVTLLDPPELTARFPALETDDVAVAAVARAAGYLDPGSYVTGMADRAREAGVTVRTDTQVSLDGDGPTVSTPGGTEQFDAVLVAAGAHSARLLADAGHTVAMKPYRVQALVTGPLTVVSKSESASASESASESGGEAAVPTTYDATGGFYLRPCDGGVLVGDGTEEREFDPDDYDETADASFRDHSRVRVAERLRVDPGAVTVDRAWAGLCTATADRNPLLGPVDDAERVFVATGWHGHGFMRAPAVGEIVAELVDGSVARQVVDGSATERVPGGDGVEAFDPRRFDGDESFDVVEGMTVEDE